MNSGAALLAVVVLGAAMGYALFHLVAIDDAYITFRVARNLAEGHGMVYNPGEAHLATSAPGLAVLLAAVALVAGAGAIPLAASLLSGLGLVAVCVIAFTMVSRGGGVRAGLAALFTALFLAFSPTLLYSVTNEMLPQAALVLGGFWLIGRRRARWGTLALLGAVLIRPDGLLALLVGGLLFVAVERRLPVRPILLSAVVLGGAALASKAFFGSALPPTMAAKQAQVASGTHLGLLDNLGLYVPWMSVLGDRWTLWVYVAAFGLASLVVRARRDPGWRPALAVAVWGFSHLAFFQLNGVAFYHWYLVPSGIAFVLCLGMAARTALELAGNRDWMDVLMGLAAAWALWLLLGWGYRELVQPFVLGDVGTLRALLALVLGAAAALVAVKFALWAGVGIAQSGPFQSARGRNVFGLAASLWVLVSMASLVARTREQAALVALDNRQQPLVREYAEIGRWLERNGVESAAHVEIGIIGWHAPSVRMVDPLGLGMAVPLESIRQRRYAETIRSRGTQVWLEVEKFEPVFYERDPQWWDLRLSSLRLAPRDPAAWQDLGISAYLLLPTAP